MRPTQQRWYLWWQPKLETSDKMCMSNFHAITVMLLIHFWVKIIRLILHVQRNLCREIQHYWLTCWPDHGTPTDPSVLLRFLLHARPDMEEYRGPTIVHCRYDKNSSQSFNYRPQRGWAKVIFSQASVCPRGGRGVCLSAFWDITPREHTATPHPPEQTPPQTRHTPRSRHPPEQTPPPD